MKKYDIIFVGAGPANVFAVLELIKKDKEKKLNILMIEKGKRVEKRACPIQDGRVNKCINCSICDIMSGLSGAGAFSDGKISLYDKEEDDIRVGGNLSNIIGNDETKLLIDRVDEIYLSYGADTKLEGVEEKEKIRDIQEMAKKENIELINIPIRHLGTEKAHEIYLAMQNFLEENKVDIIYETTVDKLLVKDNKAYGVTTNFPNKPINYYGDDIVVGVGRRGAKWLSDICETHNIESKVGMIDLGFRVEMTNETMNEINRLFYEGKIVIDSTLTYNDKVRSFCHNPGGFVSNEGYGDMVLVNGHSYKEKKSENTNLAILSTHSFKYPFRNPIEFGEKVAKLCNMLGGGQSLVQRYGDLKSGKRSWPSDLRNNSIKPTLEAAFPGDIGSAFPYRSMMNIIEFIDSVGKIIPGFAHEDNLLYAPEIKFYSNEVVVDINLKTSIEALYMVGDAAGISRGLSQAGASGLYIADILWKKFD
jgi:hypothetical protein